VSLVALRKFLASLPHGPVTSEELIVVLENAWDALDRDNTRMTAFKLGRLETPQWDGRVLTFSVERHGWTTMGSTRAEVQHWEVDPQTGTARVVASTHRQLRAMAPRLNVRPLAREVAALIVNSVDDDRLKWSADRTVVTVRIGVIVPEGSAARQTITGRRRRFREALDQELAGHWAGSSWKYTRQGVA
jgi:hypothetical protein